MQEKEAKVRGAFPERSSSRRSIKQLESDLNQTDKNIRLRNERRQVLCFCTGSHISTLSVFAGCAVAQVMLLDHVAAVNHPWLCHRGTVLLETVQNRGTLVTIITCWMAC